AHDAEQRGIESVVSGPVGRCDKVRALGCGDAEKTSHAADFGDRQADRSNDLVIAEVDKPDPAGIKSILEHMLFMHPGLGVYPLKVIGETGLDARTLGVDVDRLVDVLQS